MLIILLLVTFLKIPALPSTLSKGREPRPLSSGRFIAVRDLLNVNEAGFFASGGVQISPNGKWVAFQVRKALLPENQYVYDLWLVDTSGDSSPKQLTHNAPTGSMFVHLRPQWSPDSRKVAYFRSTERGRQIWLIDVATFEEGPLMGPDTVWEGNPRDVPVDFEWSRDGQFIAFVAGTSSTAEAELKQGAEVDVTWSPWQGVGKPAEAPALLHIVDLGTHQVRRLTDGSLIIDSFDWSPDSRQLVVSASEDSRWGNYMRTDLYLVERQTGTVRSLHKQTGMDAKPVWSPDGNWIAFASQRGRENWMGTTVVAAISPAGGKPRYLTEDLLAKGTMFGWTPVYWSANSDAVYFAVQFHMSYHLFRVPLVEGNAVMVTPDDGRFYSDFSFSQDNRHAVFARESVAEPPDIYLSSLSPFKPIRLTEMNPQLADVAKAQVEVVKWRSKDNKWDIHGALIKPPDYQVGKKYPLLVFLFGGPSMVRLQHNLGGPSQLYPIQVFAAHGYLVLAPNTRGRGGFGEAFENAIGTEKSYGPNPYEDMMGGVDLLVERGIADPDRLGILGFSYGAYLSAYSLTQTDRFKAASIGEGVAMDIPYVIFGAGGHAPRMNLYRDMWGFGSPYDPAEMKEMMRQSPAYHVQNVKTPVLLEYGASGGPEQGKIFFQGLKYFNIPSEFIVYPRTSHGIEEPLLREDSYKRNLAWFDYWLLDKPYPDPAKQVQYDGWKQQQRTRTKDKQD
ncbi:MAG: S9 family peptidase [Acidobacteria bacterium]|nr:S9 family peptidase [Acidobacteriota bacterium]